MDPDGVESGWILSSQEKVLVDSSANLHERTPASYRCSVSIHSLPTEIVTKILSTAVTATSSGPGVIDISQDIITLSHVCSYWRGVADQNARLWSTIVICGTTSGDKSRLAKYLRRSCAYPIHVIITPLHVLDDDFRGCIVSLQPHMHRIKRLFVKMKNSWVMENVIGCLTQPAAQLAELTLGLVPPVSWVNGLTTAFDARAPYCHAPTSTLFDGNTPALRSLCLSSVSLPSLFVQNLRHLTLHVSFQSYQSVDEVLGVLEECPELESLTVRYSPDWVFGRVPTTRLIPLRADEVRVSLPALRRLVLTGQLISYVSYLLARLSIPGPTKFTFHMLVADVRANHIDPGVFFKTCASTTIFSSLRILDVCASSSPLRLVAKGYNTDIGPMLQKPATIESEGSEPSLTLQFLNLHPLDALALLALGLARQRGTPTMHTLIVRGTPLDVSTHVRWRHLFRVRPARNLCTLRLIGLPTRSIQECLYVLSYPLKSVEELRAEPLLPHLATLVIVRPVGVFNKQLRKVLGKAVRYMSRQGRLETLEVVGVQGRLKTAWRRLRTFCTVKVSEDHAL